MCEMFLILKTITFTRYADDKTPFAVRENATNVIKALEEIKYPMNWFSDNLMKLNIDKCHVLLNNQKPNTIKIGNLCINNFSCDNLKFRNHIEEICKKASQKLNLTWTVYEYKQTTYFDECFFYVSV